MQHWVTVPFTACVSCLQKQTLYGYINLIYSTDDGSKGVFRASPDHGIILPEKYIPGNKPLTDPWTWSHQANETCAGTDAQHAVLKVGAHVFGCMCLAAVWHMQ